MATINFSPEDPQQFRLYDAEHPLREHRHNIHYGDKEAALRFIERVTSSPEWKALGGRKVKVVWTRHDSGIATSQGHQINLPGWAYEQSTILHELAHCITHDRHGRVFAGTALMLYRRFISPQFAEAMENRYRRHGVEFKKRQFSYKKKTQPNLADIKDTIAKIDDILKGAH